MIFLPYTDRVTSHKGVIGIGVPMNHCDASRRTPQFLRLNYYSFQVYGGSDGRARALPVHASGSRYANLSELPPSIGVEDGGFSKPNHLEATMADSVCAHASAQNPTTSATDTTDPIQLLMQAVNGLERSKSCVMAQYPVYGIALQQLESARQAIEALYALETVGV